jgi:hypothetical protein
LEAAAGSVAAKPSPKLQPLLQGCPQMYVLDSKDLKAQDNHHHQHNTTLNNGYNSITVLVQKASTTNGSHTATTHRHVLNLRNLAQNLDVPQLQEVEISLLLQAINKELQLSHLQTMAFTQVFHYFAIGERN